jgi:hypothetical protein
MVLNWAVLPAILIHQDSRELTHQMSILAQNVILITTQHWFSAEKVE